MRRHLLLLIINLIAFSFSISVNAQDSTTSVFDGLFESAPFAKPFVSEMHSTRPLQGKIVK